MISSNCSSKTQRGILLVCLMQVASLGCSSSNDSNAAAVPDEVIREFCNNGQAIHTYQLSGEDVARTVRGFVHLIDAQHREIDFESTVQCIKAIDASLPGPETEAIVTCIPYSVYVDFVREQ